MAQICDTISLSRATGRIGRVTSKGEKKLNYDVLREPYLQTAISGWKTFHRILLTLCAFVASLIQLSSSVHLVSLAILPASLPDSTALCLALLPSTRLTLSTPFRWSTLSVLLYLTAIQIACL